MKILSAKKNIFEMQTLMRHPKIFRSTVKIARYVFLNYNESISNLSLHSKYFFKEIQFSKSSSVKVKRSFSMCTQYI